jgi:hypothetical protein
MMKEIKLSTDSEVAVRRLAREHPDWLPVLAAALAVAADAEAHGGEFAGAAVVAELGRRGTARWIPNLRILVSHGLLEKSGPSTRGGRRAYYRIPDREGVERALESLDDLAGGTKAPKLRFIAAGASTEPPSDTARRSGEIPFEPRSWR